MFDTYRYYDLTQLYNYTLILQVYVTSQSFVSLLLLVYVCCHYCTEQLKLLILLHDLINDFQSLYFCLLSQAKSHFLPATHLLLINVIVICINIKVIV